LAWRILGNTSRVIVVVVHVNLVGEFSVIVSRTEVLEQDGHGDFHGNRCGHSLGDSFTGSDPLEKGSIFLENMKNRVLFRTFFGAFFEVFGAFLKFSGGKK
jgi:hypothetical protein